MASPLPQSRTPSDPQADAASWLARRRSEDCSAEEQQAFLRWLNAGEANREAYDKAEALWQELRGLNQIAERQLAEARAYVAPPRRRRIWGSVALAAAASFALVLIWKTDPVSYLNDQIYRTARGERQAITLADGSRLELNTDSEAAVHYSRQGREIQLHRGQALFTVKHGDQRPFDVFAGNARIHDIGTQFDVRRYADRVAVSVLEGAVEVSGKKGGTVSQLQQGQRLSYTSSGVTTPTETIDVAATSAWREGKLVFSGQPLKDILEELGRYHSASLTVTAPRILGIKVSGTFRTDNLPLALQTIAATLPVKLTQTGPQSWQIDGR